MVRDGKKVNCKKCIKDRCINMEMEEFKYCLKCMHNVINKWNTKVKDNYKQVNWLYKKCSNCTSIRFYTFEGINHCICHTCGEKVIIEKESEDEPLWIKNLLLKKE